jgi:PAS domain S-box-containing protein
MTKRILIADDNHTNLYMLKSLLEGEGYEVIAAENGKDALAKAHAHPPDLIVSDILMPVMDGYTFCRECKLDEQLKKIPFVFYTATYTELKDEQFALSLGADRFLLKPQEPEILMRILSELLDEKYKAKLAPIKPLGEEMEFFRGHDDILFRKLEKKILDMEIANQQLKILEERYRLTFENASDVIFTMDNDFSISSVSPSLEKILGYNPQDFIGRPVTEIRNIFTPESFEQAIADIDLILKGETISSVIYKFIAKDGTIKVGEVSGSPFMRNGEVAGLVSVARDVTERKGMEEALRESEKQYRELVQYAPSGIFEMDMETGLFTSVNDVICEYTGYGRDELLSMNPFTLLTAESRNLRSERLEKLRADMEETGLAEYRIRRKDGSMLWAMLRARYIYKEGRLKGATGVLHDITEKKAMEEALRNNEAFLNSIVENIPDMIFVKDAKDLRFVKFNKAGEALLGQNRQDLIGKNDYDFFPKSQADLFIEKDREVLKKKQLVDIPEEAIQTRYLGERILHTKKIPIVEEGGNAQYLLGISEDITGRKLAEDALRKSEARFRSYFELPLIGIAVTSPEKGWLEGNDRLSGLLGYSWQELKNMSWSEMTYPDDLAADVKQFNRILAGEIDTYVIDKRFIRKNGEVIWISLAVGCVRKHDGTVDYLVALFEDITDRKKSIESLRETLDATVQAIAIAVDVRDPYTSGHQRRVTDIACAIATEMNLSDDQIIGLRMASIIHDLGKISVPAEILSWPGKLSDIHYNLIKTHAQSGYDILKDIKFPWPLARMVLEHHERMNGSGYPNGLTGDKLLIESRILAVADVVEAMASHRPYRPALGIEAALEEITSNKGIYYDPVAVDACVRLFHEKKYKMIN